MRFYHLASFALLMACSSTVSAQQIGLTAATEVASAHFGQRAAALHRAPMPSAPSLAYTEVTARGTAFYVFNHASDGFVIVGGDKLTQPVLGYSDHGQFLYDCLPDNLRWWLSQYAGQFEAAKAGGMRPGQSSAARAPRADVTPMVTTKWNQSTPFNSAIPCIPGYQPFVTGCVATAMAQVMKFHGCPTAYGTGDHSYTQGYNTSEDLVNLTFGADFSQTVYDWGNMSDTYTTGSYTDEQAQAVATLLYHAGVSVDMNYGQQASSASSSKIPGALMNYFGYDRSAYDANRVYYSDDEWEDLVYGELAEGRPILYGGRDYNGGGGHQFVCDGYENGLYHINWGWGGAYDGYFAITGVNGTGVLQPHGSGTGGAGTDAAYTVGQTAVINVMPDQNNDYHYVISAHNGYSASYDGTSFSDLSLGASDVTIQLHYEPINLSAVSTAFQTGVVLRNKLTGDELGEVLASRTFSNPIGPGHYFAGCTLPFSTKSITYDGIYEILLVYRISDNDQWQLMRWPNTMVVPTLTVSGRQSAVPVDVTFSISGTSVPVRGSLSIGHDDLYQGAITYTSSHPQVAFVSPDGIVTGVSEGTATITAKAEATTYFNQTEQHFEITVTPFELLDIAFDISQTQIAVGESAQILWNTDYEGEVTYSVGDATIASVNDQGVVTALAPGTTTITVAGAAQGDYKATQKEFTIVVPEVYPDGVLLSDFTVANRGYVTPATVKYSFKVKNLRSEQNLFTVNAKLANDRWRLTSGWQFNVSPNYEGVVSADNADYQESFEKYVQDYRSFTLTFCASDGTTVHKVDGKESQQLVMCSPLDVVYTMTGIGWGTLCLPFEAAVPEGLTAYTVSVVGNEYLSLDEVTTGRLEMATPYIMRGASGSYTFSGPDVPYTSPLVQQGVLAGAVGEGGQLQEGDYVMQNHSGKVGFYKIGSDLAGKPVSPYRSFIRLLEGSNLFNQNACFILEGETGIDSVETSEPAIDCIFDLNGRPHSQMQPGINIVRMSDGTVRRIFIE